jgi:hypothetical protein
MYLKELRYEVADPILLHKDNKGSIDLLLKLTTGLMEIQVYPASISYDQKLLCQEESEQSDLNRHQKYIGRWSHTSIFCILHYLKGIMDW